MSVSFWLLSKRVVIDSSNNIIKFKEGTTLRTATVAAGSYYLDGRAEADSLLTAVVAAMNAAATATITSSYRGQIAQGGVTGIVTLAGAALQLIESGSTFDFTQLGFAQADSVSSSPLVSNLSPTVTWCGDQPAVEPDPSSVASYVYESRTPSGKVEANEYGDDQRLRQLFFEYIEGSRVWQELSTSDPGRTFEAWRALAKLCVPFKLYLVGESLDVLDVPTAAELLGVYTFTGDILQSFSPKRSPNASNARTWSFVAHPFIT